jgi:hypothetical protein
VESRCVLGTNINIQISKTHLFIARECKKTVSLYDSIRKGMAAARDACAVLWKQPVLQGANSLFEGSVNLIVPCPQMKDSIKGHLYIVDISHIYVVIVVIAIGPPP